MASESGFSNQKKIGKAQFKTIQGVGSDKYGVNTAQMYLYDITPAAIAITAVTRDDEIAQKIWLEIPSHSAKVGDVIRFTNNANALWGWEMEVVEVLDNDTIAVHDVAHINSVDVLPQVGDEVKSCRWVTAKADSEGALTTTSGPIQFVQDGSTVTVNEDTVDPNNNIPLPVKLTGVTGDINITAGDLNVQSTSEGPNFDAIRIGSGVGRWADITANDELAVHDADALAKLTDIETIETAIETAVESIDTKLPASLGSKTSAASLSIVQASDDIFDVQGTVTVSNFPAVQDVNVTNFPATQPVSGTVNVGNFPATQPISAASLPLPTGAATEATLSAMSGKLPAVLGQAAKASSLSVAWSTENDAQIGSVTEAAPASDTASSGLNGRLQRIAQRLTSLISLLPASLGQKTSANSLAVVIASDNTIATSETSRTGSYQEITNLTTVAQTFTAPANVKWFKIMADDTNSANIRFKVGAAATVSSGMQLQPGRSEDCSMGGNISVIAESGTNQKVYVQFGV